MPRKRSEPRWYQEILPGTYWWFDVPSGTGLFAIKRRQGTRVWYRYVTSTGESGEIAELNLIHWQRGLLTPASEEDAVLYFLEGQCPEHHRSQ